MHNQAAELSDDEPADVFVEADLWFHATCTTHVKQPATPNSKPAAKSDKVVLDAASLVDHTISTHQRWPTRHLVLRCLSGQQLSHSANDKTGPQASAGPLLIVPCWDFGCDHMADTHMSAAAHAQPGRDVQR